MPQTIQFSPDLLNSHCIIDVRAPIEFAEDHLPGAHNIPLLNDAERETVGTIHKNEGPLAARQRGLELTCARFGDMVGKIMIIAQNRPILVYCWRGGLRSLSVATLLEMAGCREVSRLFGGYKAFRRQVLNYFSPFIPPAPLYVIHGMTGTGKTMFINSLDRNLWSIIDLEGLARHRGSAFGSIGMGQQPSQKNFDTRLWHHFVTAPPNRAIVLEGESQRIGQILLPGNLYEVMSVSSKIWCTASIETRVKRLAEEYGTPEYIEPIRISLDRIRRKLGNERHQEMLRLLDSGDIMALAEGLVAHYYDRLYYRYRHWEPDAVISLENFGDAACQLMQLVSVRQQSL